MSKRLMKGIALFLMTLKSRPRKPKKIRHSMYVYGHCKPTIDLSLKLISESIVLSNYFIITLFTDRLESLSAKRCTFSPARFWQLLRRVSCRLQGQHLRPWPLLREGTGWYRPFDEDRRKSSVWMSGLRKEGMRCLYIVSYNTACMYIGGVSVADVVYGWPWAND